MKQIITVNKMNEMLSECNTFYFSVIRLNSYEFTEDWHNCNNVIKAE